MTMIAKCFDVRYIASEREVSQSGSTVNPRGYYAALSSGWSDRGTGWMERFTPSKLILNVEIADARHEIWVDRFFKDHIGRLTLKRRNAIKAAMPAEIEVEAKTSQRGTAYYVVTEPALAAWLSAVRL